MAETVNIEEFLDQLSNAKTLLLDARSESEFKQGHIPGAVNLPLLNDEHRVLVGTTYKQKGREAAVLQGFDLVGDKFGDFARKAIELSENKQVMLYCWRGGMRSNIMSWVLSITGFKITLLKGGYKTFRRWTLDQFNQEKKIVVIGGRTGTGKTDVLKLLKEKGEQVIDLEALAHHKGSAFGGLGEKPQPRIEHFENQLAIQWSNIDANKILWLENESILIGSVKIPDPIFEMMRNAPVIEIQSDLETRMNRILKDYGKFAVEILAESTMKLTKRLGDLRARKAIEALLNNDKKTWMEETLSYYDKTYDYGMLQRKPEKRYSVQQDKDESMTSVAERILALSQQMEKQLKEVRTHNNTSTSLSVTS
jgi:tRNA 2-selenouridine synthase